MISELPPIAPEEQRPVWEYTVTLEGSDGSSVTRIVQLNWCERTESWYMSLFETDGTAVLLRKRMTVNYPIGWRHTGRIPTGGVLILLDTEGSGEECGYEDLGRRCRFCWITEDEFPAAEPEYDITITEVV